MPPSRRSAAEGPQPAAPSGPAPPPPPEDFSPLGVLLAAMRLKWQEGDIEAACKYAQAAAPYLHPRARPEQDTDPARLPDDLLLHELLRPRGGMGAAAEDPP